MSTTTEVKERPILMSAPMIRAILAGRKTMTRRVMKPQPTELLYFSGQPTPYRIAPPPPDMPNATLKVPIRCPYGKPGDRLWVREAWSLGTGDGKGFGLNVQYHTEPWCIEVPASHHAEAQALSNRIGFGKWKPSIHMPRWASRITLEITDVRVERLQEIREADAKAEGFADGWMGDAIPETPIGDGWSISSPGIFASAAGRFLVYWSELNGEESLDSDPWVWILAFRRIEQERAS